ncbi:hypothetical protein [Thauera humireducens]|uniref:hypothetical protein n=1 Tax=Thauera humireducens TaxID=1134435 RepID=UPI00311F0D7E
MAYTQFDPAKPDAATQNISQFAASVRTNLAAIRDIAALGAAPGWNYSWSGGTAEKPAVMLWSKGAERLRATCTWGTTGGAADNLTIAVLAYSANSGGAYDNIGTQSVAYDASGNVTSTTWA